MGSSLPRAQRDIPLDVARRDLLIQHLGSPNFIKDETELRRLSAEAGFFPVTDRFLVIIVHIERWSDVFSSEAQWLEETKHHFFILNNMLHEVLSAEGATTEAELNYQMVCVVNVQEENACAARLTDALERVMEVLEEEFGISVTIAVSGLHTGLASLPDAYNQAGEALRYNRYFEDDEQILFYDDLRGHAMLARADRTELDQKLLGKIQNEDFPGAKYVLHEMLDRTFFQERPSIELLPIRVGGMCCKILDVLEDLRGTLGDEVYRALNPERRIAEARTLAELTATMDDLFDQISSRRSVEAQEPKPQWVDRMTDFIETHYADELLGLTEVSAAFGITPSYATRVYKQYTGRGIYETIQHVRLGAAKKLLHTDRTMKEIAGTVGYSSFLSMNRAFKKYEGTTPSRFKGTGERDGTAKIPPG